MLRVDGLGLPVVKEVLPFGGPSNLGHMIGLAEEVSSTWVPESKSWVQFSPTT
jgi:hypothetical protein